MPETDALKGPVNLLHPDHLCHHAKYCRSVDKLYVAVTTAQRAIDWLRALGAVGHVGHDRMCRARAILDLLQSR